MLRSYGVFLFLCRRGLRPLRVFSRNLCMQADVGFGPYEGNGPYPKGEGFWVLKTGWCRRSPRYTG